MAKRKGSHAHYEIMFEDFLRENNILYIAVDETRRPVIDGGSVKNFDFIVSSFNGKYLVDIKGKDFSSRTWDNWVHESDLTGLKIWGNHFNAFIPLLVIPYLITNTKDIQVLQPYADIRKFKGKTYGIIGVTLADYYSRAKIRSKKFTAIYVSRQDFLEICKPLSHFIPEFKKNW
ncbi:MAG: HYExAFE family protein [Nitrosarchaeum sp.]|nr:HYExAFE family protein [Nitrosarchaeum sp.]